jgi:hypothetical protein
MPEAQTAGFDRDDSRALRVGQLVPPGAEERPRALERCDVVTVAGRGCDDHRRAGGLGKPVQPSPKSTLECLAHGKRLGDLVEAGALAVREVVGQLDHRQRIAHRQLGQPPRRGGGDPAVEKIARLVGRESSNDESVEACGREGRFLSLPEREQDRHPLVAQPARGEADRLRRLGVEPVSIVHNREHGLVLRRRSEQAERGGADSQGVGRRRRTERQRGGECLCLRLGQRRRELGDRTGEREQAGVRQLALRLDAGCTQDAHAARTPHCFLEQGGLPDARLAHKDERAAASALDRGE